MKNILAATLLCASAFGQQVPPAATPPTQQDTTPAQQSQPHGTVLFHRNDAVPDTPEEEVKPAHPELKPRPAAVPPAQPKETEPSKALPAPGVLSLATDAQRNALTFTSYDLDVRLEPAQQSLAVRAKLTVRNDGTEPLAVLPLQLSSTLHWESIRSAAATLKFQQQTLDSDVDHTGRVNEAVVSLPVPLAPQESITLDVIYSGTVPLSGERVERIGAPADAAQAADWDRISADFTGLRGFGNVLWYPAASEPLALGDGARLFTGIGRWKLRQSAARFSMRVMVEHFGSQAPLAVLNGHVVPAVRSAAPQPVAAPDAGASSSSSSRSPAAPAVAVSRAELSDADPSIPHVATYELPSAELGFQAPSLFLFTRIATAGEGVIVYPLPEHEDVAKAYTGGVNLVQPLLEEWFGKQQAESLALIDLPEDTDQPFEAGDALLLPLRAAQPSTLTPMLAHALTHARFSSPRIWMSEGLAQFTGLLWTERTEGREAALLQLGAGRDALALAEPEKAAAGAGQSLLAASDVIYYRTKAAYVWWMLRSLAGDKAMQTALQQYRADQDVEPAYFQHLLEAASKKDLQWFFDDWVYHDRGLPDFSIATITPRQMDDKDQYLVAVEVANDGDATAEIPVTVRAGIGTVSERLRVPARSRATTRILLQGRPDEVMVNDGTVPESRTALHRQTINLPPSK